MEKGAVMCKFYVVFSGVTMGERAYCASSRDTKAFIPDRLANSHDAFMDTVKPW